ncbi:hypothetical protein [Altererythrobacter sp. Root672]|uniref:hypothetical protein n=1 Tax=Altererythrobacter sp. Root672 TaxID=1736584 RepID=UPI0006F30D32|nr:hypothetical protein [Altererythrobacter sp. Root672]KRA83890.1 hypothetical protein ASD76_07740 [Altererythrobacter sp. Root672]
MRASRIGISAGMLAGFLIVNSAANAQALDDKYWAQVAAYYTKIDTKVRISPASNPNGGTQIDLEDDLNFDDDEILPSFSAGARLGGGFQAGVDYYALNRDSTATLARDITINDVTYPVSASVTGSFKTNIYRFTIGWAFVRKDNFELGAAIGAHVTDISFGIEGQGTTPGGTTVTAQRRQQDVLAPLPTVGVYTTFNVAPKLTLGARIDYLSLSIDKYDGRLINTQASLAYRFTRNFGVGVMYRYVDYRLDVEKSNYVGRFAYKFRGPAVFLEAGF